MKTNTVTLHNVNTDLLRKYFNISSSVGKSEVLNFELSHENITAIVNNETDTIFKQWSITLTDLCEKHEFITEEQKKLKLKCSIYKGGEFSKKILNYFGQTVNITFHYINNSVNKLELFKLDEKGKISLKITVVTAPTTTSFIVYDDELMDNIFNPAETSKLVSFDIYESELAEVTKLAKLATNPEIKTDYLQLYTHDGYLKVTDNSFDLILHETEAKLETPVEIEKTLWSMIDNDNYIFDIHSIDDKKFLCCLSKTKSVKTTLVLLSDVDEDIEFDDFKL